MSSKASVVGCSGHIEGSFGIYDHTDHDFKMKRVNPPVCFFREYSAAKIQGEGGT